MFEVMTRDSNNKKLAFAHSISADFGEPKRMSAGVAVAFTKMFGKPRRSDCVKSHLSYQRSEGGAAVYGLLTKNRYNHKPSVREYNISFQQLAEDFKKRGLVKLVCSPMGCVRDEVPIGNFIKNIVMFQLATGARVDIITYPEKSVRVLRKGMCYSDFVKQLQIVLANECCRQNIPKVEDSLFTSLNREPEFPDHILDTESPQSTNTHGDEQSGSSTAVSTTHPPESPSITSSNYSPLLSSPQKKDPNSPTLDGDDVNLLTAEETKKLSTSPNDNCVTPGYQVSPQTRMSEYPPLQDINISVNHNSVDSAALQAPRFDDLQPVSILNCIQASNTTIT